MPTTGRRARRGDHPRRVIRPALYGFIGSGNLGNDASFEVVLDWLRRNGNDRVEPQVLTLAPDVVRERYGLPATSLRLLDDRPDRPDRPFRPGAPGRVSGPARKAGRAVARLLDLPRTLVLVHRADAVIVPGMGVLEEKLGVRPWGLPLWLAAVGLACRLMDRPFVLLCVGAEPVRNPVTRALFRATIALADHVSYRDGESAMAMAGIGARPPRAVAADLVLAEPAEPRRPRPGRVVFGVMRYFGDEDDVRAGAAQHAAYLDAAATAVATLVDDGDHVVLVVGDAVDCASAHRIRELVAERRPGLDEESVQVRCVPTYAALSEEIAQAEAVVASRFHNLVCAVALGVPVVSVGYADKNAALMADLGLASFSQSISELDPGLLVDQLRRARDGSWPAGAVRAQVAERAEQVERVLTGLAEELGLAGPR